MDWRLADAKNRFRELVTRALDDGPQRVRRRGDAVVVLDEREYERLRGRTRDFKTFLMRGASLDGVELTRDRSSMRDAGL